MEAGQGDESIAFRRFRILPRERRLLADGKPANLRPRAFDLLLALVEAAGSVVLRDVLIERVWQDRTVTENNLQVQIAALRNALGPDRDLIRTVAGRGYQFTGRIEASRLAAAAEPSMPSVNTPAAPRESPQTNVPEAVSELIGRKAELDGILALARAHRLVTLIGAGGIGKTRLALETARHLQPEFADGVWIVEMSTVCDPAQVPHAVAIAMGLPPSAAVDVEQVALSIDARETLIILDTCEHVIAAAAEMAEALLRRSSGVRVIATSREPLGAYDEWVYRIGPLGMPPADETALVGSDAVSLFVARAQAINVDFSAEQPVMAAIATICRKLEGIPLAIELAATRAATLGVHALASRLDDHLKLLTCGRRTALPRHQTLRATLDWSYQLLSAVESTVLGRLALCSGEFDLGEAHEIAAEAGLTPAQAIEALVNLVAKSLVSAKTVDGKTSYRLPGITRAYALEKLVIGGEFDANGRPHAEDQCKLRPFGIVTPSNRDRKSSPTRLRFAA
jgi:predicted ATPase/DNA-binding winged helix-turn-helix (wHTH) protein